MFQLTAEEASTLRFQIGMSKGKGRGGRRYLPYVFTEQGVAMLSNLNFSPIEKTKAALRGIKVVSANSYAKGEERPYGDRVYNRTDGISATGAAPSDREI
jgi:hypothetical protein